MNTKYPNLLSPIKIGTMTLPNRIVASPLDFHHSREKSVSGSGLQVLGCGFTPDKNAMFFQWNRYKFDYDQIQNTKKELDFLRQGGSKVEFEILHSGMFGNLVGTEEFVYGPCEGIRPMDGRRIKGMTREDMDRVAKQFHDTAFNAKKIGFDAILMHFAHGWLASSFLSPTFNHRTDEYGGSYENRVRFPKELLRTVREAVGPRFPIDMRINGADWVGPGMPLDEVARFVQECADEGLINACGISSGHDIIPEGSCRMATGPLEPHCFNKDLAKYVKERVSIPVAVVAGIETPEEAEELIRDGYCDMVWIGRAMCADPQWARKAIEGRSEDIRPCLRCNYCHRVSTGEYEQGCSVNPRMNKEEQYPMVPAQDRKRAVVIGGGPAGMVSAITLKLRGHDVRLYEKSDKLGGALKFTDYVPSKQDLRRYKNYLIHRVEQEKIEVHLNTEVTPEMVKDMNADAVFVSVGASPVTPRIPGAEKAIQSVDALFDLESLPETNIIIGGGTIGCELAIALAEIGKKSTIIEFTDTINGKANSFYATEVKLFLEKYKDLIQVYTNSACTEITDTGIKVKIKGEEREMKAEKVILSVGLRGHQDEAAAFYGTAPRVFINGDCSNVALVKQAAQAAFTTAYNLGYTK